MVLFMKIKIGMKIRNTDTHSHKQTHTQIDRSIDR